jgi:hypothetical protein
MKYLNAEIVRSAIYQPALAEDFAQIFGEEDVEVNKENMTKWQGYSNFTVHLWIHYLLPENKRKEYEDFSNSHVNKISDILKMFVKLYSNEKQTLVDKMVKQCRK